MAKILTYQGQIITSGGAFLVKIPEQLPFITEWYMSSSGNFTLPTGNNNTWNWNYYVNWGDGSSETHVTSSTNPTHNYASAGIKNISIRGSFPHFYMNYNLTERNKLRNVIQWGEVGFKSFEQSFLGCYNFENVPNGPITGCTDVLSFTDAWGDCTIESIPATLFQNAINATTFINTFSNSPILNNIPSTLFATNTKIVDVFGCFSTISGINNYPTGLFNPLIHTDITNMTSTFKSCDQITNNLDELWTLFSIVGGYVRDVDGGYSCFSGCENAINFGDVPPEWGGY